MWGSLSIRFASHAFGSEPDAVFEYRRAENSTDAPTKSPVSTDT